MRKKVILLVEDDELDVISVRRSLKKLEMPYELHTAFNGIEALDMLRGNAQVPAMEPVPNVLLLDLNMPGMNGLEFLAAIRGDDRLKDIQVFVMTTSGEHTDRTTADGLGVSGYLVKPMSYSSQYNREDSMEHFVQFHLRQILSVRDGR
jgi:CheY-like chemotaxis protein